MTDPGVRLAPLDLPTARAVAAGRRAGRAWAPDFPSGSDVEASALVALAGDLPRDETGPPWRQPWLVVVDGLVAGTVGVKGPPEHGRVEIGYGVVPSVRDRGCATAAVGALLALLRGWPVDEVVAETAVGNAASARVLRRSGFTPTGERDDERDGRLVVWSRRPPG